VRGGDGVRGHGVVPVMGAVCVRVPGGGEAEMASLRSGRSEMGRGVMYGLGVRSGGRVANKKKKVGVAAELRRLRKSRWTWSMDQVCALVV
jgi:hypothetical protein